MAFGEEDRWRTRMFSPPSLPVWDGGGEYSFLSFSFYFSSTHRWVPFSFSFEEKEIFFPSSFEENELFFPSNEGLSSPPFSLILQEEEDLLIFKTSFFVTLGGRWRHSW